MPLFFFGIGQDVALKEKIKFHEPVQISKAQVQKITSSSKSPVAWDYTVKERQCQYFSPLFFHIVCFGNQQWQAIFLKERHIRISYF